MHQEMLAWGSGESGLVLRCNLSQEAGGVSFIAVPRESDGSLDDYGSAGIAGKLELPFLADVGRTKMVL